MILIKRKSSDVKTCCSLIIEKVQEHRKISIDSAIKKYKQSVKWWNRWYKAKDDEAIKGRFGLFGGYDPTQCLSSYETDLLEIIELCELMAGEYIYLDRDALKTLGIFT